MTMPWNINMDPYAVTVDHVTIPDGAGPDGAGPDEVGPDGAGADRVLTCRYPAKSKARGVVVFCHGLGSSGAAYGALTEVWAKQGYLVIHPTFDDSIFNVARAHPELGMDPEDPDLVLWVRTQPQARPVMRGLLLDPDQWRSRVRIVQQVLDQMPMILAATGNSGAVLPMAIAGHSFGAYTAQLFAGVEIDLPEGPRNFRDHRFAAALVLSGQGRDQQGLRDGSWDQMTGPVLTVTGEKDGGAKGQDWHWKCEPYELAPAGGKYLAVLDDATHYLGGMTPEGHTVPDQAEALAMVTSAFLDAHVLERASAQKWLDLVEDRIAKCPVLFKRK